MNYSYENFPAEGIHHKETFISNLSNAKLQQKMIQALFEINFKTFTFEQVCNPTVPNSTVILEVGIADSNIFTYIDELEAKKIQSNVKKQPSEMMDFFLAVRSYKDHGGKKKPLKFDYYMMRFIFFEGSTVEAQVFHERGPRYIQPEDLLLFIVKGICKQSPRRILRNVRLKEKS